MKIFMTVMMMMAMTSVYAGTCTLGGECKVEADCKALNPSYSLKDGKCNDPASSQKETQCAGIVGTGGAKPTTDSVDAAGATGTKTVGH
ncbi:MAG: hypothetical protein H7281_12195 [Bacteriovorax sp.]|nr:hypothetical protein [Bacteriovorax sp.]